ncbi:MAG: HEAT repeat domain-containing protein, partial [Phycisphaerales bacterium]|nr:HEAT repeat domain-containing protein [Phycisphaerales bacterium]
WNAMMICADIPAEIAANPLLLGLVDPPPQTPADVLGLTIRRQLVAARSLSKLGAPLITTLPGRKTHIRRPAEIAVDNLTHPDPGIRALAAFALGEILVPRQAAALTPLLNETDPAVQRAAAAATINIYNRNSPKP